MEYSSFIDLSSLSEDARKELENFYQYLVYKYQKKTNQKSGKEKKKEDFLKFIDKHSYSLSKDYKFNREELHERKNID